MKNFANLVTCSYMYLCCFSHTAPPESTQKLSSLKSKVKEREERQRQRERMLAELTAPTIPVANESQLREECGKNHWSTALVLMLEACTSPRIDREDRERLMKVHAI